MQRLADRIKQQVQTSIRTKNIILRRMLAVKSESVNPSKFFAVNHIDQSNINSSSYFWLFISCNNIYDDKV